MKYFTKEELEDITRELLGNPTRETLKNLNEKYNGSTEVLVKDTLNTNVEPPVVAPIPITIPEEKTVEPIPGAPAQSVVNPIPSFNVPKMEEPKVDGMSNSINVTNTPSFELPKLETPFFSNQSNEPVAFSGNLWEAPKQEVGNLMQTTDNFSSGTNTISNTEVPVTGAPFFGPSTQNTSNSIPVTNGPTMFGQLEQNYM